jgi:hypothetical protein
MHYQGLIGVIALKGQEMIAQGAALGRRSDKERSSERARFSSAPSNVAPFRASGDHGDFGPRA